jgi:RNA polymerase sigma-70 factor (ECF subfamily)
VPDAVAEELADGKRYNNRHGCAVRRNKVLSLDAEAGMEIAAGVHSTDNPEAILERKEQRCRLCWALNSLPETQGRRIEAYYLFGKSQTDIAKAERVTKSAVSASIERGLKAMKRNYQNFHHVHWVKFCTE